MKPIEEIQSRISDFLTLCKTHKVKSLYIFGSSASDNFNEKSSDVEEKKMFQSLVFMVNGKLCAGVRNDEILVRIDPEVAVTALERIGTRAMINNGRIMEGYVFVSEEGYKRYEDFDYWIKQALDFNKYARISKKR